MSILKLDSSDCQGWLQPDWPVHSAVKALFSLRHSATADGVPAGISTAPFDRFNLGNHVGDAAECVAANRLQLAAQLGSSRPVFLNQVHGYGVLRLAADTPDGLDADASVTALPGVACTVLVADCLPVLLASSDGRVVAAVHAGWRGLAGVGASNTGNTGNEANKGILEATAAHFQACFRALDHQTPARAAIKIIAWLGPCIGPEKFEVGAEVRAAFMASMPDAGRFFTPSHSAAGEQKFNADLAGLARLRLQALGVGGIYGNDSSPKWCTASGPLRYFSHRRDAGSVGRGGNGHFTTGRMAACIWRT